jgi:hypothetical protein
VTGLAKLMHTPNGLTFKNGMQSTQVPIGPAGPITIGVGKNVKAPGAAPKGHMVIAPVQTPNPIYISFLDFKSPSSS